MPENEDQERPPDHEIEDLDGTYSDASGCDRDEFTYLDDSIVPLSYFSSPEPGPSCMSRHPGACTVFQTAAQETDGERSEDEHGEIENKLYQDTYVSFEPDAESDSTKSDAEEEGHRGQWPQNEIFHPAEEARALEEQHELQKLGSRALSQWEKDNLKAAAYKITHQITKEAFEGLRYLTESRMEIGSDFVANRILERASKLKSEAYNCCVNSCMCYTGEFDKLTECSICGEPRLDKRRKARNQFRYIPIIPRLQAMYKDPKMISMLLYRMQRDVEPGDIEDVFDGEVISDMMKKYIELDGVPQAYKYGELDTDIFMAFTCDGVSIHKGLGARRSKTQYSCFPLEVIILNLPPMVRTQNRYVFSLGVIPGPREPKHLDSFCWPFYLECRRGLQGIRTYHTIKRDFFSLHFFVPHGFDDLIAVIKMKGTRGVGAKKPCHQCHVRGIRDETGTGPKARTYYIPLTVPGTGESRYETEILHNLRTRDDYLRTYHQLDTAKSEAERKKIREETGINRASIWSLLPYFDMGRAIPGGYMHAVCINLMRALVTLWRGEFKGLNAGSGAYIIPAATWEVIGEETRDSNHWMPAAFVRSLPNIHTDFGNFTAEASSFWMMYIAPHVLRDRLPEPYYIHMLDLVTIMKTCTKFGITRQEHAQLSVDIYKWRLEYEEYYCQYNPARFCTMTLALHEMDHLPDDILNCGPPTALWEFVTERSMGDVVRSVTSRSYPFSQLANTLLQCEQLKVVQMTYPDFQDSLDYTRSRRDWDVISRAEMYYLAINDRIILRTPHDWYRLHQTEKVAIAVYFKSYLELEISARRLSKYVPDMADRWGKIRIKGDPETVHSAWAQRNVNERHRDASFARVRRSECLILTLDAQTNPASSNL